VVSVHAAIIRGKRDEKRARRRAGGSSLRTE
jgi:hypothetical protein